MVYTNDIEPKMIKDLSRCKITYSEFLKKMNRIMKKVDPTSGVGLGDLQRHITSFFNIIHPYEINLETDDYNNIFAKKIPSGRGLCPVKLISPIVFNTENTNDLVNSFNESKSLKTTAFQLNGFTEINGFPFFGFVASGDWEHPVYVIIFALDKDDDELYAYVPRKGNTFNPKFNTAFGSETEGNMGLQEYKEILEEIEYMQSIMHARSNDLIEPYDPALELRMEMREVTSAVKQDAIDKDNEVHNNFEDAAMDFDSIVEDIKTAFNI